MDLSRPEVDRPDYVFAVPTFVLNDRLWSLGNSRRSRLVVVEAVPRGARGERTGTS